MKNQSWEMIGLLRGPRPDLLSQFVNKYMP